MPNLSGTNIAVATLTGTFIDFTGVAVTGSITFTPSSATVTDAAADLILVASPITVSLVSGGTFSVSLPVTDDPDGNPVDFTYMVKENFPGGREYPISLPAGGPYDLADLSPESSASAGTVVWAGMPSGGTTGQVATKLSATNYDIGWAAPPSGSNPDAINVKTEHAAAGDAIRVTGNVTGTTLTLTSGTIPSGWTSGKTAVIETAGSDGVIPHVATFTRNSSTTATLGTSAGTNRTGVTIWIGTNDTSAIQAARDAWLAAISNETVEGKRFTKSLYFPPGAYIVTSEDALVVSTGDHLSSIRGGLIHGSLAGAGTRIIFATSRTSTTAPTSDRFKGNLMTMKWRFMERVEW